jgi:hypothetical protein
LLEAVAVVVQGSMVQAAVVLEVIQRQPQQFLVVLELTLQVLVLVVLKQ